MCKSQRIVWFVFVWVVGTGSLGSAAHLPTLDELKVEGASASTLRQQISQIADEENLGPALGIFRSEIEPILRAHCVSCHGPEKTKARLRIDELDPDLQTGSDVDWWLEVMAALGTGEMPPPEDSELPGEERGKVIDWLSGEIRNASLMRRAGGEHSSFRRMTRYEYNYALQDLLGLPREFARDLPPEAHSEDGFQNSSETLHMSVAQLETYRRLARNALRRATVRGSRPAVLYWGVTMQQRGEIEWKKQAERIAEVAKEYAGDPEQQEQALERLLDEFRKVHRRPYFKDLATGRTAPHTWNYGGARYASAPTKERPEIPEPSDHVVIIPQGHRQKVVVELGEKVPDEGILRVRVRASRTSTESTRVPSLQLEFGWQASNEGRALLKVSDEDLPITAPPGEPQFYQWDVPLGDIYPRNSVRKTSKLGSMPNPSEHIRLVNSSASPGDIQIDYVEVMAPVYDEWPPASHQRIFFASANRDDESLYAEEILSAFMPRAWRRQIASDEIERKLKLFEAMRATSDDFEEAMVEVLSTILSSPNFLYLAGNESGELVETDASRLSEYELATRLSMFLWCSVPDDRLLTLASEGRLSREEVLSAEVQRMLDDSRSLRFAEHFVHQWLDLQLLDFLKPEKGLDVPLKEAMQREPVLFFREMLRGDESVLNCLHADYTMANERLAQHYGLNDVYGNHFRRVKLESRHRRGGLLTQAGLLAMNSSGEDSNPLKRGIWLLESLLNDPPPPPPPAVPEIDLADPEIAKMTLKERMADHRDHAACRGCHSKIDPWGIALENYDALGRWREEAKGRPVDATSLLFNNEPLNGMDGLKRFLLKNRQDQFVRALTHKMSVYALGRPSSFADRAGVEEIAAEVRRQGDGLATLVLQVATSDLFLSK